MKNPLVNPVLKWVGGKRQLLSEIKTRIPPSSRWTRYVEPFLGGGAVFFALQPTNALINDTNAELITVYTTIRDHLEELIVELKKHAKNNSSDYYYEIRRQDREPLFKNLSEIQHAARLLYLNKTCYNGLFRVNSHGEFNSPFGSYTNPNIVNEPVLRAVSKYLNNKKISIRSEDYQTILKTTTPKDFIYLDPPYDPVSNSSSFTGYSKGGFDRKDQIRLRDACIELNRRGIPFLLSNSNTPFIQELYKDFRVEIVFAKRSINAIPEKRGAIEEVLVRNYE